MAYGQNEWGATRGVTRSDTCTLGPVVTKRQFRLLNPLSMAGAVRLSEAVTHSLDAHFRSVNDLSELEIMKMVDLAMRVTSVF